MEKEFFDNAFDKAKSAIETAYKKTGEIVSVEKLKFNISSQKSKREKLYAALGKNFYDSVSDASLLDSEKKELFDEITEISDKIDELYDEINYVKSKRVCPHCSSPIDENAVFCSKCGEKVIFDSAENE